MAEFCNKDINTDKQTYLKDKYSKYAPSYTTQIKSKNLSFNFKYYMFLSLAVKEMIVKEVCLLNTQHAVKSLKSQYFGVFSCLC